MTRVYIHEYIDIIGHHRADYMHHMTARWGPVGRAERAQLCVGVWATVGSTGRWPQVVNLWEYADWPALGRNFEVEQVGAGLQDPSLSDWWSTAAAMRSGGDDRIFEATEWTPGITDLAPRTAGRVACYTHDHVRCAPGAADLLLAEHGDLAEPVLAANLPYLGLRRALGRHDEYIVIRGWESWQAWAEHEALGDADRAAAADARIVDRVRIVIVDAPLAPLRTGVQP